MADIIGILNFALHAAHKVYDVVQKIKDAPTIVQALGKEASRVMALLTVMLPGAGPTSEQSLFLRNVNNNLVGTLVEDAKELEAAVKSLLAKVTTQRDDGTIKVKKSRWLFSAGEAEKLSARFQAFYGSLTAVYAVVTS